MPPETSIEVLDPKFPQNSIPGLPAADGADIREARINPDLLRHSPEIFPKGAIVNGKPPGYLSSGDWEILSKYSKPNQEPPMGHHDIYVCPECKH